jgi:hypothetical protein
MYEMYPYIFRINTFTTKFEFFYFKLSNANDPIVENTNALISLDYRVCTVFVQLLC